MQDIKYKVLGILIGTIILGMNFYVVQAMPSGDGKKNTPYVVSNHNDLEYALTEGKRTNAITYIAIRGKLYIKKNIDVDGGSFFIYANDAEAGLIKSTNKEDKINDIKNPTYCFRIGLNKETKVEFGSEGPHILILGGQRNYYEINGKVSSGWMYIGAKGSVVLGENAYARNMINNDKDSQLSNFTVFGGLEVKGIINNCTSSNGGAICAKSSGIVRINDNAIITNCSSDTEGGAIWIKEKAKLYMNGGTIKENYSAEEGGGIFVSGTAALAQIVNGNISDNYSGQSAGGIFAGYGATLIIGAKGSNGPVVEGNVAAGSGGGIRANGGKTDTAGGKLYIYSGTICRNKSGKYGGGIGIGQPGSNGIGVVHIENVCILQNSADRSGGGIYLSKGNKGINEGVQINASRIEKNSSVQNGGGIFNNSDLKINGNIIEDNVANNGGAIYISSNGSVIGNSGRISHNRAGNKGKGIYLDGLLKVGGRIVLPENNDIYICRDKYVEVYEKFSYNAANYMSIDSAVKYNATKLVYVAPNVGTGELLLYGNEKGEEQEYENLQIVKYLKHINLNEKQILRSSGKISGMGSQWIIISEKYNICYASKIDLEVDNMPQNQVKFYNEPAYITEYVPTTEKYEADIQKLWNTKADGTGLVYKSGSKYEFNEDITLYVIWIEKLIITMHTVDRYYVVGQDVYLTEEEILKKIIVKDSLNSNYKYEIKIIKICDKSKNKDIFNNIAGIEKDKLTEYLTTSKAGIYELTLYTQNEKQQQTSTMRVYVLSEKAKIQSIRFISSEYIYTLKADSTWRKAKKWNILKKSLNNKSQKEWLFSISDLANMKKYISQNGYKETNSINYEFYKKFMWGRETK